MKQILAIDIGNTTTACGLFHDADLVWTGHLPTAADRPAAEFAAWLSGELDGLPADPRTFERTALASVVPAAAPAVCAAIRMITGREPLLADRRSIGLHLAVNQPETVGADRMICALAASRSYSWPVIVVDLGTATTISVVDGQGRFIGGTISPGLQTAADALHQATAQLPGLDMASLINRDDDPPRPAEIPVIGADTAACIRSGIIQGTAAMIDGLTARIEEQLGSQASLVITGGLSSLVQPLCRQVFHLEPDLLLQGLRLFADHEAQEDT